MGKMFDSILIVLLSIVKSAVQNCDVVCKSGSMTGVGQQGGFIGGGQVGQMTAGMVAQPAAIPCVCGAGVGGVGGGVVGGGFGGISGGFGGFGGGSTGGFPGQQVVQPPTPQPIPSISYYTSLRTTDTSDCSQTTL